MVNGGSHFVVSLNKLHVYSHFVHVYYMFFDCLQKGNTAETSLENIGKNFRFDFSFI